MTLHLNRYDVKRIAFDVGGRRGWTRRARQAGFALGTRSRQRPLGKEAGTQARPHPIECAVDERDILINALVAANEDAYAANRKADTLVLVAVCSMCLAGVFLVLWLTT